MRMKYLLLLVFMEFIHIFGEENEHVHLKIYVPDIIKHNIHTKTIYVNVHIPKKKKPQKYHQEMHHENWNTWNAYNHGSYHRGDGGVALKNHMNHLLSLYHNLNQVQNPNHGQVQEQDPKIPFYDDYKGDFGSAEDTPTTPDSPESPVSPKMKFESGVTGHSYSPQYATQEDVDDISPNDIGSYEYGEYNSEGHKKGHEIEKGRLHTGHENNYYTNKLKESGERTVESSAEKYGFTGNNYLTQMLMG